ncbi:MAG: TetR family transcriptional regulator [Alphaproteobacteria bacterium 64-11]|nr:MAG: TetR family transcriptional regulator [Alphaproteobacteria bacterium 64-11]
MAAGRPRSFCTEKALDSAMQVFWRKGYEGASMVELTTAMGINSPSLYAAFGSKEGLFRQVLDRYDARRQAFMESVLNAPTAREAAHRFLHGVADFVADTGGKNPPGCLLMQCGSSCGDDDIPDVVARHRAEKEAALRDRFARAVQEGDLPAGSDPGALARYLTTVANGIAVQAAAGYSPEQLHAVADIALASLPAAKTPEAV